jgi:hypothetical protein
VGAPLRSTRSSARGFHRQEHCLSMKLAELLYQVRFVEREVARWHPDVRY